MNEVKRKEHVVRCAIESAKNLLGEDVFIRRVAMVVSDPYMSTDKAMEVICCGGAVRLDVYDNEELSEYLLKSLYSYSGTALHVKEINILSCTKAEVVMDLTTGHRFKTQESADRFRKTGNYSYNETISDPNEAGFWAEHIKYGERTTVDIREIDGHGVTFEYE